MTSALDGCNTTEGIRCAGVGVCVDANTSRAHCLCPGHYVAAANCELTYFGLWGAPNTLAVAIVLALPPLVVVSSCLAL